MFSSIIDFFSLLKKESLKSIIRLNEKVLYLIMGKVKSYGQTLIYKYEVKQSVVMPKVIFFSFVNDCIDQFRKYGNPVLSKAINHV